MNKILRILFLFSIVLILSSCHSKYGRLTTTFSSRMAWNHDSTAFAFAAMNEIYRKPKGIATFPDGGMTKTEYFDAALYYFDTTEKKLHRVTGFEEKGRFFNGRDPYKYMDLAFAGPKIYFKLDEPLDSDIKSAARQVRKEKDSLELIKSLHYIYKTHVYDIHTGTIVDTDSLPPGVKWTPARTSDHQRVMQKSYLKDFTPSDWGIDIRKQYPQSKKDYFDYIIYRKGYYDLVLEQIAPGFTEKDKKHLLKKMTQVQQNFYRAYKKYSAKKGDYNESQAEKAHDYYTSYTQYMETVRKRLYPGQN